METTGTSTAKLFNTGKACFVAILLFCMLQLCPFRLMWQVGGDDLSYLSHAFTIALDFDLDYSNEPATSTSGNGKLASHPLGPGVMAAPFVALFSIVDRATGNPVIANHALYSGSWSYFGFLFSSVFYYLSGIALYYRSMLSVRVVPAATAFLLLTSSGAAYFAMNRFTLGHSFEFFLFAVVFWGTIRVWSAGRAPVPSVCAALAIIFCLFVRPANINVLILPLLLLGGLTSAGSWGGWRRLSDSLWPLYLSTALFAVPFALFNHYLYGVFYPNMTVLYKSTAAFSRYGIDPANTGKTVLVLSGQVLASLVHLPNLLFGSEHGLLYSTPLSLLGTVLLLVTLLRCTLPTAPKVLMIVLVLGYVALPLAIVLLWKTTAGSYGYRYLFPIFPVGVMGYLLWFSGVRAFTPFALWLNRILVVLCLFSVLSQVFFSMTQKLEVREGINGFGINYKASANGYDLALAGELLNPRAWLLMLAKKTPGFVAFNAVQYLGVDPEGMAGKGGVGADYRRALDRMKAFQHGSLVFSPGAYLLQISVLLAYIAWFALCYCRTRPLESD
ncbi:hypothetical protein KP005_11185 [Geomonas nitrogeniifigens]|uniref:Glycosyltransferase RgtA/B/C/D-like domain-containing protein n=1 Tax=Geomonas diazotrophica TaxID=2843197 RepID=A0ABX8JH22_9BACT|nr:hypothetical protein [Geomonas nitrogeniifigens]QWV95949.1 hypothetical protein KP005_11185 [Geomonas nitrogeniifigens]